MKSILYSAQFYFIPLVITLFSLVASCNEYSMEKNENATHESALPTPERDGDGVVDTTSVAEDSAATVPSLDSIIQHHLDRPVERPGKQKSATGTAMVYCPAKMIKGIPSIVNATISRDEFSEAFTQFSKKIQQQNPGRKAEILSADIKGDSIDLYEKMGVLLEFDPEDFKQLSNNDNPTKAFKNKKELEWEWVVKPLHSTRKSIINFKFYYIDPNDSTTNYILQKTISIDVNVDARSYIDKWKDFLLDDPKTTTTAIVIPLVTFLGGFFTAKKKKKEP